MAKLGLTLSVQHAERENIAQKRGVAQPGLARSVRDAEVGGSNPLSPTIIFLIKHIPLFPKTSLERFSGKPDPHTPPLGFILRIGLAQSQFRSSSGRSGWRGFVSGGDEGGSLSQKARCRKKWIPITDIFRQTGSKLTRRSGEDSTI